MSPLLLHILPLAVVCLCMTSVQCRTTYTPLSTLDALDKTRHHTLAELIRYANLTSLFDKGDNYTIFAPEDRAFQTDLAGLGLTMAQLKADPQLLTQILSYHVLAGTHPRSEMWNERTFTTLNGAIVRTNHYVFNNYYFVDGAQISSQSVATNNTLIHTIRHVLAPINGSVYDTIAADPELSTLKAAIDATGLQGFLADQNPITIFAPTNDAFALLGNKVQDLLGKPDVLKDILTYHVIPGGLYRGGMHDETLHTFEEADRLTLDRDRNGPKIDAARFNTWDISTENGVIHKISAVLVPDAVKGQI